MAHNEPAQGNKPGMDPSKFGLKFDGDKGRWELMPDEVFPDIVRVASFVDKSYLMNFNMWDCVNMVFDAMNMWRLGAETVEVNTTGHKFPILAIIAFNVMFIIRGKSYTQEELDRSTSPMRWDLIDPDTLDKLAQIYAYGAKKYADENWKLVAEARYYAAFMRHFKAITTKARYDDETGFLHMYQALWNVVALRWFELKKIDKREEEDKEGFAHFVSKMTKAPKPGNKSVLDDSSDGVQSFQPIDNAPIKKLYPTPGSSLLNGVDEEKSDWNRKRSFSELIVPMKMSTESGIITSGSSAGNAGLTNITNSVGTENDDDASVSRVEWPVSKCTSSGCKPEDPIGNAKSDAKPSTSFEAHIDSIKADMSSTAFINPDLSSDPNFHVDKASGVIRNFDPLNACPHCPSKLPLLPSDRHMCPACRLNRYHWKGYAPK